MSQKSSSPMAFIEMVDVAGVPVAATSVHLRALLDWAALIVAIYTDAGSLPPRLDIVVVSTADDMVRAMSSAVSNECVRLVVVDKMSLGHGTVYASPCGRQLFATIGLTTEQRALALGRPLADSDQPGVVLENRLTVGLLTCLNHLPSMVPLHRHVEETVGPAVGALLTRVSARAAVRRGGARRSAQLQVFLQAARAVHSSILVSERNAVQRAMLHVQQLQTDLASAVLAVASKKASMLAMQRLGEKRFARDMMTLFRRWPDVVVGIGTARNGATCLTAATGLITLDDVELGPYEVRATLTTPVLIEFVPHANAVLSASVGYPHPHLNVSGLPCWGNATSDVTDAAARGDAFTVLALGLGLLHSYNEEAPYCSLDAWSNSDNWCDNCEEEHDDNCPLWCSECSSYSSDDSEHVYCDSCDCCTGEDEQLHVECTYCSACLYNERCECCERRRHCTDCCADAEHSSSCAAPSADDGTDEVGGGV